MYRYHGFLYINGYNAGTTLVLADSRAQADMVHFGYHHSDLVGSDMKAAATAAAQYARSEAPNMDAAAQYANMFFIGSCSIESEVPLEPLVGTDLEYEVLYSDPPRECKAVVLAERPLGYDGGEDLYGDEPYRLWYSPDGAVPAEGSWYHPDWSTDDYAIILLA